MNTFITCIHKQIKYAKLVSILLAQMCSASYYKEIITLPYKSSSTVPENKQKRTRFEPEPTEATIILTKVQPWLQSSISKWTDLCWLSIEFFDRDL